MICSFLMVYFVAMPAEILPPLSTGRTQTQHNVKVPRSRFRFQCLKNDHNIYRVGHEVEKYTCQCSLVDKL